MTLSRRGFLLSSLFCALFASLLFLPGLPGGFILDDFFNIVLNQGLQLRSLDPSAVMDATFGGQFGGATRVLPTLTFALDYFRGGGLDPATFKVTNIGIHALTTVVLACFLRDLLTVAGTTSARARWAALALALAWAMHPLQVSSVLYIVQRMQTLATLFILLAMWTYLRARLAQMEARPGRTGLILTGLLWAIALGCKEDAVLLPAYLLAMELTVLRFRAADPSVERNLRRGYLGTTVLGAAAYLFIVVPHFWSWEAYAGRDFSSIERLLTQGRVLCLYLGQMLFPLPSQMPFFYDWIQPSRGLLQPWTTVPAILLLTALLAWAWRWRHSRPLFSLGILLFFAGHFVSSNVIGLELAFEHRNHLPLVGIVLAIGSLLALAAERLRIRHTAVAVASVAVLAGLAGATATRAASWSSAYELASTSTQLAPDSARAWQTLCVIEFEAGGSARRDNPNLDKAIAACNRGAEATVASIPPLTNVIAFKGIQGSLTGDDWDRYLHHLEHAPMTPESRSRLWVILDQVRNGVEMDQDRVLEAIDIYTTRAPYGAIEFTAIGYYILGHTGQPDRALPHFQRAVRITKDPAFADGIVKDLREEGYPEWADQLQAIIDGRP